VKEGWPFMLAMFTVLADHVFPAARRVVADEADG